MVNKDKVWNELKKAVCPKCGSKNISALPDEREYYLFDCDDCDHVFGMEVDEEL